MSNNQQPSIHPGKLPTCVKCSAGQPSIRQLFCPKLVSKYYQKFRAPCNRTTPHNHFFCNKCGSEFIK